MNRPSLPACAIGALLLTSAIVAQGDTGRAGAFRPVYKVVERTSVDAPGVPRRRLRIIVPAGLTRNALESNVTHAAKAEQMQSHAKAVIVFAYRTGTNPQGVFSAAKCEYAPFGDWARASENVSLSQYKTKIEISPEYKLKK